MDETRSEDRERKVIPYDRAYNEHEPALANQNADEEGPSEETQREEDEASPLGATEPMGMRYLNPEDVRRDDDTETAQEVAEPMPWVDDNEDNAERDTVDREEEEGKGMGITSIVLSLISIFLWPAILASAGIIVGFIAFRRGARTTGTWGMVIGAFSLIMALIMPTFAS